MQPNGGAISEMRRARGETRRGVISPLECVAILGTIPFTIVQPRAYQTCARFPHVATVTSLVDYGRARRAGKPWRARRRSPSHYAFYRSLRRELRSSNPARCVVSVPPGQM